LLLKLAVLRAQPVPGCAQLVALLQYHSFGSLPVFDLFQMLLKRLGR
jgi:hypothetical protein